MTEQATKNKKTAYQSIKLVDVAAAESDISVNLKDESVLEVAEVVTPEFIEPEFPDVGVFVLSDSTSLPKYGTMASGCFDLSTDFGGISKVTVYDERNAATQRQVRQHIEIDNRVGVLLNPGERAIIPTNLIFDIPTGYVMKIYCRSGVSIKNGLNLSNGVGYIDEDYVDPVFILVTNTTAIKQHICQGSRLAQAEIVKSNRHKFKQLSERPSIKTDRTGGLGHTGTGVLK